MRLAACRRGGSGVLQGATDVFSGHSLSRSMTRGARAVLTLAVGGSSCTSHTSHDSQASWIVASFILEICVAEGLISTSVVEQLVKPGGWSRASRAASSTVSSGLSATRLPPSKKAPRRPFGLSRSTAVCRAFAPNRTRHLVSQSLWRHLPGSSRRRTCRHAVPYSETSTSRGGIPQEHPPRFRSPSGNHCGFSA
jgi:hypothetical protein